MLREFFLIENYSFKVGELLPCDEGSFLGISMNRSFKHKPSTLSPAYCSLIRGRNMPRACARQRVRNSHPLTHSWFISFSYRTTRQKHAASFNSTDRHFTVALGGRKDKSEWRTIVTSCTRGTFSFTLLTHGDAWRRMETQIIKYPVRLPLSSPCLLPSELLLFCVVVTTTRTYNYCTAVLLIFEQK